MLLKTLNHTILYFMIRFISGVIGLVSIYILTRLMSVKEYGNFTLLIAIVTFTSGLSFQWLSISTSRLILEYKKNLYTFVKASVFLFLLSSIVALFIIYISTYIYPQITKNYFFILLSITIILGLYNMLIQLANIVQKPLLYGSLSSSRAVFSLVFSIILIVYFNLHTLGALIGFGTGFFISILLFLFYFKPKLTDLFSKRKILPTISNKQLSNTLFRYGFPLSLTYLAIMIINVSDRLMLGKMSSISDVATYSAAYDFTQQSVGTIMNILFLSFFPKILHVYTHNMHPEVMKYIKLLATLMFLLGTLLFVIFLSTSNGLSSIMFGNNIAENTFSIMPIIAIAIIVGCYKSYYIDIVFQLKKNTLIQLKITALMALLNIIVNIIIIPYYGATGAAYSTLISFLLGTILSFLYGKKFNLYPNLLQDTTKTFLAGVLTYIIISYTGIESIDILTILSKSILIIFIYTTLILLFNISGYKDYLVNMIRKA